MEARCWPEHGHRSASDGEGRPATEPSGNQGASCPLRLPSGCCWADSLVLTLFTLKATCPRPDVRRDRFALLGLTTCLRHPRHHPAAARSAAGGRRGHAGVPELASHAAVAAFAVERDRRTRLAAAGGTTGYVRDVTAGLFDPPSTCPASASSCRSCWPAGRLPANPIFVALAVCSDVGGYFAGILLGKHPMAPKISPKKTWEGFAGSVLSGWPAARSC